MRCNKCGFISFDYLSECKKCRSNLTATRDGLGLLDVRPSIPLYLGALVGSQGSIASKSDTAELIIDSTLQLGDSAIDTDSFIDLQTDDVITEGFVTTGVSSEAAFKDAYDSRGTGMTTEMELSDDDLSRFLQDTSMDLKTDTIDEVSLDSGLLDGPEEKEKSEAADDDMVIELSGEDIENLLVDLEQVPPDEGKDRE